MKKVILVFIAFLVGLSLLVFTKWPVTTTPDLDEESEHCPVVTD